MAWRLLLIDEHAQPYYCQPFQPEARKQYSGGMVGDIFQPTHLLFVLVVALLVLGPKRLPEVGRTLGNGIRDFQSAIKGESPERPEELHTEPWRAEPEPEPVSETKHEFAGNGDPTPSSSESHEFAHVEPAEPARTETVAEAHPVPATEASAATPDATASAKHEFAAESPEPADAPAGPWT
jgi:sec-independent protein translocase protein TatA